MLNYYDEENESSSFMMGSLHTLSTPDEVKVKKKKGPQVRIGFHPPDKAWIYKKKRDK